MRTLSTGNLKSYTKITSYLSPLPVRNRACRRVSYLPWDKIHRRCPIAESKERTRNTWGDRRTPAPFVPPAKVPTLGRSPRILSRNACHTNNIQYFHITFTHQWQNYITGITLLRLAKSDNWCECRKRYALAAIML